jgi:hypothetical protein
MLFAMVLKNFSGAKIMKKEERRKGIMARANMLPAGEQIRKIR